MAFADLVARTDRAVQEHLGGVAVTYAPEAGAPVEVVGMFDDPEQVVLEERAGVEIVGPSVVLRLEDLPVNPDDDNPTITIGGVNYTVHERSTDGEVGGSIRLYLHEVA